MAPSKKKIAASNPDGKTAKNPTTARILMFNVSAPWASFWFDIFNVVLFLGAFAVAVGTYGTIKMGAIKEKFADERIAANEAENARAKADGEQAKAGSAKATERAAEANKNALEVQTANTALQLELEKERVARLRMEEFLSPRLMSEKQKKELSDVSRPFAPMSVDIFLFKDGAGDVPLLAMGISESLTSAGWTTSIRTVLGSPAAVVGVLVMTKKDASVNEKAAATTLLANLNKQKVNSIPWEEFEASAQFPFAFTGNPIRLENQAPIRVYVGMKGQ